MTIQTPLQLVITIGIIALGTFLIRALPFFLFPSEPSFAIGKTEILPPL